MKDWCLIKNTWVVTWRSWRSPPATGKLSTPLQNHCRHPTGHLMVKSLIYNSEGLMYHFDLATRQPTVLPTGDVKNNNNDHVLSFDGKMLALSSGVQSLGGSDRLYSPCIWRYTYSNHAKRTILLPRLVTRWQIPCFHRAAQQ